MPTTATKVITKEHQRAEPFLRWAGGKKQLLKQYSEFFPDPVTYERYIEPFVGGGAIFFHLNQLAPKKSFISDSNGDLVNTYKIIKKYVTKLICELDVHQKNHSKEYYYQIRDTYNKEYLNPIERAAVFIYLNKTNFNGLHRVNSSGYFNVPYGQQGKPKIYDEKNLYAIKDLLKNVVIKHSKYETTLDLAQQGDFIYLDPPYFSLEGEKNFTTYVKDAFLAPQHEELARRVRELHDKGCRFMLSNSDSTFIRNLYSSKEFRIIPIEAKRYINCIGDKRGNVKEILVVNY